MTNELTKQANPSLQISQLLCEAQSFYNDVRLKAQQR